MKDIVKKYDDEPVVKIWVGPHLVITTNKPNVVEVRNFNVEYSLAIKLISFPTNNIFLVEILVVNLFKKVSIFIFQILKIIIEVKPVYLFTYTYFIQYLLGSR